jgi:hypothetical protein
VTEIDRNRRRRRINTHDVGGERKSDLSLRDTGGNTAVCS